MSKNLTLGLRFAVLAAALVLCADEKSRTTCRADDQPAAQTSVTPATPSPTAAGQEITPSPEHINLDDFTRQDYIGVDVRVGTAENLSLGAGVKMTTGDAPIYIGSSILVGMQPTSIETGNSCFEFKENVSVEEDYEILSTYFSTSFFVAGAEGRREAARTAKEKHHVLYVVLERTDGGQSLSGNPTIARQVIDGLSKMPFSSREQMLKWWNDRYGSHYIQSVTTGSKVLIRAELNTNTLDAVRDFRTAFHVSFFASASKEEKEQSRQRLSMMNFDLRAVVVGQLNQPGGIVMRNVQEVGEHLDKVKSGEYALKSVPLKVSLRSYRSAFSAADHQEPIVKQFLELYTVPPVCRNRELIDEIARDVRRNVEEAQVYEMDLRIGSPAAAEAQPTCDRPGYWLTVGEENAINLSPFRVTPEDRTVPKDSCQYRLNPNGSLEERTVYMRPQEPGNSIVGKRILGVWWAPLDSLEHQPQIHRCELTRVSDTEFRVKVSAFQSLGDNQIRIFVLAGAKE